MIKLNEDDYAYASARIRALEIRLLDSGSYDRMMDAPTAEEAFKVLSEAEYGMGGAGTVSSLETVLEEEMKKCHLLLLEIAPQADIIKAFFRRNDYFNVKVLLKAELSGQETPPILVDTGTMDKETIRRIIRERDYDELDPDMREAVAETYDAFSRARDPQIIDLILDKASYRQFVNDLRAFDSPFLHELAALMVDIANIKMFIRARFLNKAWDFLKKLLLDGGNISEKTYFENSDKPVDAFIEELRFSKYGEAVRQGWELYKVRKNISGLEKLLDDFLMGFVRSAKMVTMGIEPVIAYLFAKETEIRNVRIIMTGKINGLSADLIRERLRLGYV